MEGGAAGEVTGCVAQTYVGLVVVVMVMVRVTGWLLVVDRVTSLWWWSKTFDGGGGDE